MSFRYSLGFQLIWVLPMIIASYQNLEQIKQDTWEETAELNSRSKQWIRQQYFALSKQTPCSQTDLSLSQ